MTSIAAKFADLKARGEKALVLFVTAGDPRLEDLPAILSTLEEGGADLVEVGIPFSDPIADGPTIQASSQRALDQGVTPSAIYELLAANRASVPLVAMGYYNAVLRLGLGAAAETLARAGFSGTIVSDLTPEESGDWKEASRQAGLDTIFLAAPTSTDARLDEVCRRSSGFVYAVSRMGVTDANVCVPPEARDLVTRIKARTALPVCVGFGISKPEHVRMVCEVADGAVIGSWLVDLLHREWKGGAGRGRIVELIRELKAATR
ncbi:MAG TPA: tryptophan synthase subunit alpha [Fimbriimonadaceae bacterium]|nr:tryptophan synthase subunit alpha [Fimbriimonadaceae bacterium]